MKKISILILVLFAYNTAFAQFEEGQSFISGAFSNYLNNDKDTEQNASRNTYSHNIDLSFGKFIKANKAVGWTVTHNLQTQKFVNLNFEPKRVQNFGIGGGRFWEFYKPLNTRFALYARPSVGMTYNLLNEYNNSGNQITSEKRTNKITFGASFSAGIAWRVSPKWGVYGGFAFSNPLNISTSFSKNESFTIKDSKGENRRTKETTFGYQFVPSVTSGGISLGLRYFL